LQRQHDGQLAFNFIDGSEKVRVARCTRMEYDATGAWALEAPDIAGELVAAGELPLDNRMMRMLYRDGEWYCSIGRFEAGADRYVSWANAVATGLTGQKVRGSFVRLYDGQLAFSYFDGAGELQTVRCTEILYNAEGAWS